MTEKSSIVITGMGMVCHFLNKSEQCSISNFLSDVHLGEPEEFLAHGFHILKFSSDSISKMKNTILVRQAKLLSRQDVLGIIAGETALRSAGIDSKIPLLKGLISAATHQRFDDVYKESSLTRYVMEGGSINYSALFEEGLRRQNPLFIFQLMSNAVTYYLAEKHGFSTVHASVCSFYAPSLEALRIAVRWIEGGQSDCVLVIASDLAESSLEYFLNSGLSFDRLFSLSDGAAAWIIESERSAEERSAKILGYLKADLYLKNSVNPLLNEAFTMLDRGVSQCLPSSTKITGYIHSAKLLIDGIFACDPSVFLKVCRKEALPT